MASKRIPLIYVDRTRQNVVDNLRIYFKDEIDLAGKMPNFGDLRIGVIHPFAIATMQQAAGNQAPDNLFPSLTVSRVEENKNEKNPMMQPNRKALTAETIDEYAATDARYRLLSDDQVAKLKDAFQTLPANARLIVEEYVELEDFSLILTLWADNFDFKELLYDAAKFWVQTNQQLFTNFNWINVGWTGDRDGLYNMDFGRLLYGASVTIRATQAKAEGVAILENVTDPDVIHKIWEIGSSVPGEGYFYPKTIL